jgi:uncharacterized RDD family membrane protein YckC
MAFCANCGHEMLVTAAACPECGHPSGAGPVGTQQYAGFGIRFLAVLIDGLILLIPSLVFGSGRFLGGLGVTFLYHWLMIAYWNGQTIGKRAMNIRIARPDGSAVDLGVAAVRSAMRLVSGIALGLGFLWAAWDPEKRTWHDMVADTRAFRVTQ